MKVKIMLKNSNIEKSLENACDELLKQIDAFPSLDVWWNEKVLIPTLHQFMPQFLALLIVEIMILYTRNWIAALLGAVVIVTKTYQTTIMLSVNKLNAVLVLKIRDSFNKGIELGESKINQNLS
jgi:hypothetical protein